MATYLELYDLKNHNELLNKMYVAVVKKAQLLLNEASPTSAQVAWASNTLNNPRAAGEKIYLYVLAANSTLTTTQIVNATDSAIQTQVNTAADALIAGGIS